MWLKHLKNIRINLTTKFVILFLTIASVPLAIAVYISYDSSQKVLQEESAYHLWGVSDNRVYQIEAHFVKKKREADRLAKMPSIVEAVEKFNQVFKKTGINSPEYITLDQELRPLLTYFQESSNYDDLFFLTLEGEMIFSVKKRGALGINYLTEAYKDSELTKVFEQAKTSLETKISDFKQFQTIDKPVVFIATPVLKGKNIIGVIVFQISNQEIYEIAQDYTGLGKTGETVIVSRKENEAIFITPLRYDPEAAFKKSLSIGSPKGLDIQKALQGQKSWGVTTDYRGEKVLATWRYLPTYQWGLVVKMDAAEVFSIAAQLRNRLLIISSMLLIMIILITVLMAHSISDPIKKLTRVAGTIARGNLLARARINSGDEIEELAHSFNSMTDSLLETQSKLEEKTEELAVNLERIERQNKELGREKNKVSQEKDKVDAILHSIGEGVFVIDTDLKITMFNQAAEDLSDFTAKEAIGKKYDRILKFVSEKDGRINDKFIQEAMATGEIKETWGDTLLVREDGRKASVANSAAPLKDNQEKVIGCVIAFRDITREREIDRAKSEFVSLASHQLRTPLSSVSWYAEMLLDEDVGKINKDQEKYLQSLYEANLRMVELVNALLNVSRIELGTFAIEPEPTNFIKIADSVLKELAPQIKEKKLKIKKNYALDLPIINADPKLLRIILQNLFSNSVKYTPEKGQVTIEITKQESDALIKVSDTGYGIPKAQQSKIFTKLFRADNVVVKDTDGTGLGLYIVKAVAEQSGGKIWFESKENKGTTFYVTIPLAGMRKKKGARGLAG
ncbi:PAS domain-containing protein [Patescibacteria group bacterium]|nr:PAS domain-containing protein [Patescibacteria group bacterium]